MKEKKSILRSTWAKAVLIVLLVFAGFLIRGKLDNVYEQIKEKFKELIISGAMTENDKIPSVRELAATLAINPNTIQKAYKDLENEGYIYSQRARGSFVAPQSAVVQRTKNEELYERLDSLLQEIFFCGIGCDEVMKHVRCVYGDCN